MNKVFDCVTFFQENLQMELRFSILNEVVDKFVVCESIYDHRGKSKKINFSKGKFNKFKDKIIILSVIDNLIKGGAGQAVQNMNLKFGYKISEGLL